MFVLIPSFFRFIIERKKSKQIEEFYQQINIMYVNEHESEFLLLFLCYMLHIWSLL